MKTVFVLLALFVVYAVADDDSKFKDWKEKQSENAEESGSRVRTAFKATKMKVKSFPQKVQGVTPKPPPATLSYVANFGAIKDQGKTCFAEWAMAVVDLMDAKAKVNKTTRPLLSDQNILDCDKNSMGCQGGHPVNAIVYSYDQGVSDGTKYKYVAKNQTCQRSKYPSIYKLTSACGGGLGGDDAILKQVVATYGPVIALISTDKSGFDTYKSGVFADTKCSNKPEMADTAVIVVGYGTDAKLGDFWTVRYFAGTAWGEKGYMRIKRGKNQCGIANEVYGLC